MTVFERIKKTAADRGLTLTQVSAKAGLGEKTIYKWKYNDPSAPRLQAVADVLNVSVDYLLGNTDDPSPASKSDLDIADQVGGLFRSVAQREKLDADAQKDLKDEIEDIIEIRTRRLREKKRQKNGL